MLNEDRACQEERDFVTVDHVDVMDTRCEVMNGGVMGDGEARKEKPRGGATDNPGKRRTIRVTNSQN